jgi:Tol biopolymer transport system component
MSRLHERFRLLDQLEVPEFSGSSGRAGRRYDRQAPRRRILVAAAALLIGLAPIALMARSFLRANPPEAGGQTVRDEFVFAAQVGSASYKVQRLAAGGTPAVLNDSLPQQVDPAWSPDGRQLAFSGGVRQNTEPDDIYVMNADGSGLRQITSGPKVDLNPTWSPDGHQIAFADLLGSLYIVDVRTLAVTSLTDYDRQGEKGEGPDQDPDWSPDGSQIVFSRNDEDAVPSIFVIDADGSNLTRLTDPAPGSDIGPTWSPDGTRIAFVRRLSQNEGAPDIYVMNADGTGVTQLTDDPADDGSPTWSPDANRIAFSSDRDHPVLGHRRQQFYSEHFGGLLYDLRDMELYVMNADGTNETRQTFDAHLGYSPNGYGGPDWRPGGDGMAADVSTKPTPTATTASNSSQYRFVNVRIVSQDANAATVSYGIAWETANYPGVRRCTWTAIGSDGSVVGSFSDKVVSLSPTVPGTNVKTEIPIRSQAQKVNVSCGDRLDTGEPYEYEFTDIVVQEPLELTFRYRWLGPAAPGAVSCVAMVLAPDGTIKAQTRSNLFSLLRKGQGSFRFDRSQVSVGESEPSRLEGQIDCVPYE